MVTDKQTKNNTARYCKHHTATLMIKICRPKGDNWQCPSCMDEQSQKDKQK